MGNYRLTLELSGREKFYKYTAPVITGCGAAVVIIGALFKLMHWPTAESWLIAGLGTEALIFFLFAFAPIENEPDWSIVYPELAPDEEYEDEEGEFVAEDNKATSKNLTKKLDKMLDDGNINDDLISKLSAGFKGLSDNVSKMGDIAGASVATTEYSKNVKEASKSLGEMNKSYASTIQSMSEMAGASKAAQEYHGQIQNITKNLGALNAVYEMELQDANNHLKAMNKFYGNLSSAMDNMAEASSEADQFKSEMKKLSGNLTSLNNVYGNMLNAMKG